MSGSPTAETRLLSVSIVAGPSARAVFEKITATNRKRRVGQLSTFQQEAHDDPAQIVEQIRGIAGRGEIDHLIIECDHDKAVMAYAALFQSHGEATRPLTKSARLQATAMAIKPEVLLGALLDRPPAADPGSACFIAEQIEFASDIILEGARNEPDFELARALAIILNPRAKTWELSDAGIEEWLDAAGNSFDFGAALDGARWRKLIDADESGRSIQNNIASFAYRARRPFHPERFWDLLQKEFPGIFRAKGFFWLATRMDLVGGLNLAGSELHCASAGEWWAARNDHARQVEMPARTRNEWREPFGDRRQAIAFMALDLDPDILKGQLDTCLLTDAEMAAGEDRWRNLADPFPSWSAHAHDHECEHEHASGDHECCHH